MLLHDGTDPKTAKRLLALLKKARAGADECLLGESGEGLDSFLENISRTLCLVLYLGRPGFPAWVHFVAGYALAIKLPVLLYGSAQENPGSLLSKSLIPVKNEQELSAYAGREMPDVFVREIQNRAKYKLLEGGIPFTEEAMTNCVVGGNSEAVSLFIEAGYSPNIQDRFGVPLLNLAARMGDRKIAAILLKAGARLNQQAEDRLSSALLDAVAGSFHGIVKDLLAAGADVNLKSRDGQSALIIAVGLNDRDSAEMLLRAGADPDEPDKLGASARKYASLFNKPAMTALFNAYNQKR
jgi:ankyrin repeat protein